MTYLIPSSFSILLHLQPHPHTCAHTLFLSSPLLVQHVVVALHPQARVVIDGLIPATIRRQTKG